MERASVLLSHSSIKVTEKHIRPGCVLGSSSWSDVRRSWSAAFGARTGTPEVLKRTEDPVGKERRQADGEVGIRTLAPHS